MRPSASDYVTLVEVLDLTRPFEDFAVAIGAALRRLETEGVQELVTVQFYADPGSIQVDAILTFSDRARMIEHMNMVSGRVSTLLRHGEADRRADVRQA